MGWGILLVSTNGFRVSINPYTVGSLDLVCVLCSGKHLGHSSESQRDLMPMRG
jgi:hypothetical protein